MRIVSCASNLKIAHNKETIMEQIMVQEVGIR